MFIRAIGIVIFCFFMVFSANAETIHVNYGKDIVNPTDCYCSLREAIFAANNDSAPEPTLDLTCTPEKPGECAAGSGPDIIYLGVPRVELTKKGAFEDENSRGDFDIAEDVVIKGRNLSPTIIDGNRLDRIFHVHNGANLGLKDLVLEGGRVYYQHHEIDEDASLFGGAVFVEYPFGAPARNNSILLTNVYFRGNKVKVELAEDILTSGELFDRTILACGGALAIRDQRRYDTSRLKVKLDHVLFESNLVESASIACGGGLYVSKFSPGAIEINQTQVTSNTIRSPENSRGGGAYIEGSDEAQAIIQNTSFIFNEALVHYDQAQGGGLFCGLACSIKTSTFYQNLVRIRSASAEAMENRAFGGGLYLSAGFAPYLVDSKINQSTVVDNRSDATGGRSDARAYGGGVFLKSNVRLEIMNSVLAQNEVEANGDYGAINADLAGESRPSESPDYVHLDGKNIIGDTHFAFSHEEEKNNLVEIDAAKFYFGVLGEHSGFTQSLSLQRESHLLNRTRCQRGGRDQRGVLRSEICDIGAFELE